MVHSSNEKSNILLVEEDDFSRELLLTQCYLLGYTVETVNTGLQGLSALSTGRHHLILTDLNLDEKDGFEMTKTIREKEAGGEHIPIIGLTQHDLVGKKEKCFAAGVDDTLTKPVIMEQLKLTVNKWVNTKLIDRRANNEQMMCEPINLGPNKDTLLKMLSEVEFKARIKDFLQSIDEHSHYLNEASFLMNRIDLQEFAHRIKSACLSIHANSVENIAKRIELSAARSDWDELQSYVKIYNSLISRLKFVIQKEFA